MFNRKESEAPATSQAPDLGGLAQAGTTAVQDVPDLLRLKEELVAAKEASKNAVPPKISAPGMLTPEMQAYMSASISEAVKGVFAQMAPILQSIALTPEKLAAAEALRRAPTEDELAKKLREKREKKLMMEEQEENRQNLARNQSLCPHRYPTGMWAVNVVNNYPDRQPRFLCSLCQSFFEPRRWVIGAPTPEEPRGRAYIADAHKDYVKVSEVLATKGV